MRTGWRRRARPLAVSLAAFFLSGLSGCAMLESRPVRQMAYAEAALQGAILANAETNPEAMAVFQIAKDNLSRARSYYRLKNFRECRLYAVRARRLAEEAEWKALRGNSDSKEPESMEK